MDRVERRLSLDLPPSWQVHNRLHGGCGPRPRKAGATSKYGTGNISFGSFGRQCKFASCMLIMSLTVARLIETILSVCEYAFRFYSERER